MTQLIRMVKSIKLDTEMLKKEIGLEDKKCSCKDGDKNENASC